MGDGSINWGDQTFNDWEVECVVEVGSKTTPAGTFFMYKNSGNPLYRFKTKEEWETDPLTLQTDQYKHEEE